MRRARINNSAVRGALLLCMTHRPTVVRPIDTKVIGPYDSIDVGRLKMPTPESRGEGHADRRGRPGLRSRSRHRAAAQPHRSLTDECCSRPRIRRQRLARIGAIRLPAKWFHRIGQEFATCASAMPSTETSEPRPWCRSRRPHARWRTTGRGPYNDHVPPREDADGLAGLGCAVDQRARRRGARDASKGKRGMEG